MTFMCARMSAWSLALYAACWTNCNLFTNYKLQFCIHPRSIMSKREAKKQDSSQPIIETKQKPHHKNYSTKQNRHTIKYINQIKAIENTRHNFVH